MSLQQLFPDIKHYKSQIQKNFVNVPESMQKYQINKLILTFLHY